MQMAYKDNLSYIIYFSNKPFSFFFFHLLYLSQTNKWHILLQPLNGNEKNEWK